MRRVLTPTGVARRGELWALSGTRAPWSDDREFARLACLVQRADGGEPLGERETAAIKALHLSTGPFLAPLAVEWNEQRRARLRDVYCRLLRRLVTDPCAVQQFEQASEYGEWYLPVDPDGEGDQEGLMRSYARLGNRLAALRYFQRYAAPLREELQSAPPRRLPRLADQLARDGKEETSR